MLPISTNNSMTGYIPSTDFGLFQLPQFGELFANSLGLASRFQNSDPTDYVNYSVNSLAQILQPQQNFAIPSIPNYGQGIEMPSLPPLIAPMFQGKNPTEATIQGRISNNQPPLTPSEYDRILGQYGKKYPDTVIINENTQPQQGKDTNIFGGKIPIWSSDSPMVSDGSGSGNKRVIGDDPTKSGDKAQSISDFFKTLPEGSGIFLIAIVIIILIFLFVKGR